ncbi:hypothetical protein O9X98_10005 [Agrobacterium salinitolerans]|nr:hypothetical protein [Agrobacterium salinitolerans]
MTTRSEEGGQLFPPMTWDHGWLLSLQADRAGYQCSPKARLETLEDYETVEAKIDGPHGTLVDPHTMELPPLVAAKFPHLRVGGGPSLGAKLTWDDVEAVVHAIRMAGQRPNNGVPRGVVGWAGRTVYHGTADEDAADILESGVVVGRGDGYFGRAFYVAEDGALAKSNYAEFSGDDAGGTVLEVTIEEGARILDLRNDEDYRAWSASGLPNFLGTPDFDRRARQSGVDGVYDRSVGGLAIYNVAAISAPMLSREFEAMPRVPAPVGGPKL